MTGVNWDNGFGKISDRSGHNTVISHRELLQLERKVRADC